MSKDRNDQSEVVNPFKVEQPRSNVHTLEIQSDWIVDEVEDDEPHRGLVTPPPAPPKEP